MSGVLGRGYLLAGLFLVVLPGCGWRAEMRLVQPSAPSAERNLALFSQNAFTTVREQRREYLATFPAPGAVADTRDILFYVSVPAGLTRAVFGPGDESAARGFMIQAVGLRAGRSNFVSGTATLERDWWRWWEERLKLDGTLADGTYVRGLLRARSDPFELGAFVRQHAADIDQLRAAPASAPAESE